MHWPCREGAGRRTLLLLPPLISAGVEWGWGSGCVPQEGECSWQTWKTATPRPVPSCEAMWPSGFLGQETQSRTGLFSWEPTTRTTSLGLHDSYPCLVF